MSKLDDMIEELEQAVAAEEAALRAFSDAGAALTAAHQIGADTGVREREAYAALDSAKATMESTAQQLISEVDATMAGRDNRRKEVWGHYARARDGVSKAKAALAEVQAEGSCMSQVLSERERAVDLASVEVARARKVRQDKAAAVRPLIASEFAGYCGKGLPKAELAAWRPEFETRT